MRRIKPLALLAILSFPLPFSEGFFEPSDSIDGRYYQLALEATDWATAFQVTPPGYPWGIPYHDQKSWGLDPYFYKNGTITGGREDVPTSERQSLAFLIGGHDAGQAAVSALEAYVASGNSRYLDIFRIYLDHFKRSQLPSQDVTNPGDRLVNNTRISDDGYWAEQARIGAGKDGIYGTGDDEVQLQAAFPSAEHGNPIAYALIFYYKLSRDPTALTMLNRYGSWLLRTQIRTGEYEGAFPVTQEYFQRGWKPRMYETSQSAWILSELYDVTGNRSYLEAAIKASEYMLKRQYRYETWNDRLADGALPYEWNRTEYNHRISTNHAGYTLLALLRVHQITRNQTFLFGPTGSMASPTGGAVKYGNWLLRMQVTEEKWGDKTYASDRNAVGGFYYGYDPTNRSFGWRVAQSVWGAAHAIKGLLMLTHDTGNETYKLSAHAAAQWLSQMRYEDTSPVPLQALGGVKYYSGSWWGRYPQFYQPDIGQIEKAGMRKFVERVSYEGLKKSNPSWFEKTFGVDFNQVNYQMVSRGDKYMKMIWSWWPDVGFEPRYGSDVAQGFFSIAGYHNASETSIAYEKLRNTYERSSAGKRLPREIEVLVSEAAAARRNATTEFTKGWYAHSIVYGRKAASLMDEALRLLKGYAPFEETVNQITFIRNLVVGLVLATVILVYLNIRLGRRIQEHKNSG